MNSQALVFLLLSVVAASFGFTRISGQAAVVARVQSALFLILAVLIGAWAFLHGS